MNSFRNDFEALVREDLKGKRVGLKTLPLPKEVPKGHVLVRVAFAPMNPSDWMYFLHNAYGVPENMTPPPSIAGFEGSGTVAGLGQDVDASLLGAKVAFFLDKSKTRFWGTWAEYCVVPQAALIPFPPEASLEDVHSCFVNPATVFAMGEGFDPAVGGTVLFNAGGSSICRMAARYLKQRNVRAAMIVRREAHVRELLDEGAEWALDCSQPDFLEQLRSVVAEAQPKVFFDAVGGPDAVQVLKAMPDDSVLYNYGALSKKAFSDISSVDLIFRNKSIR